MWITKYFSLLGLIFLNGSKVPSFFTYLLCWIISQRPGLTWPKFDMFNVDETFMVSSKLIVPCWIGFWNLWIFPIYIYTISANFSIVYFLSLSAFLTFFRQTLVLLIVPTDWKILDSKSHILCTFLHVWLAPFYIRWHSRRDFQSLKITTSPVLKRSNHRLLIFPS